MTVELEGVAATFHPDVRAATETCVALAATGVIGADDLREQLYGTWYARPTAPPDADRPPADFPGNLAAVLRASDAAGRRWEAGWVVERIGPAGMAIVRRDGERRVLYRADYVVPARPGLAATPGDTVLATVRRDLVDPDRSWWRTRGPAWIEGSPPEGLVRLYWDVSLEALPQLVALLTSTLGALEGPWLVKCAVDPTLHSRPDAVLAYVRGADLRLLETEIAGIRSAIEPTARGFRPPFTLAVGPGLSIADDPGRRQSFGEHRCGLVARAVLAAAPDFAPEAVADAVTLQFAAAGIDPRRPWAATRAPMLWESS